MNVRGWYTVIFLSIAALVFPKFGFAQSTCDPSTPSFIVDLTDNPDSLWFSPSVSRDGNCCSTSNPDQCIEFLVSLGPTATGLNFYIHSGANPGGALYYQIDCGLDQPVGQGICLPGDSTYRITFCKPGANQNVYSVQSISGVTTQSTTFYEGCEGLLTTQGLVDSTIVWRSISPGASGAYNFMLSCDSACDSSQVTSQGVGPGTYYFEVSGASKLSCDSGKILVDTAVVTVLPGPKLLNLQPSYNCAAQTYSLDFTSKGGDRPFQFSLDSGQTWQVDSSYLGLTPGTYNLRIQNSSGCDYDTSFYLKPAQALVIDSIYRDPPSCGLYNGVLKIFAQGERPFTFRINGGPYQTDSVFTGLGPGSYQIQVRDSLGCTQQISVSLSNQASPVLSINQINNPSCNNSDGSIQVQATGAAPPFEFAIRTPSGGSLNFQSDSLFTNLGAGTYTLIVRDTNSCYDSTTYSLTEVNDLVITSIQSNAPGCSQSNGSLAIFTSGGQSPLVFSIDSGGSFQSSNNFQNLGAGTYHILVKDQKGCTRYQSFQLNEPLGPGIDLIESKDANCDQNNGSLRIYASGGKPPYAISIDGGLTYDSTTIHSNLAPGTYPIVVVDQDSCKAIDTVRISALTKPEITEIDLNPAACSSVKGSIGISAIGLKPLLYSIDGGVSFTPDSLFQNLDPGNYQVQIQDSVGCIIDTNVFLDNLGLGQIDSVHFTHEICDGSNGSITIFPSGDGQGLSFSIDGGSSYQSDSAFTNLSAGAYTLIVLHSSGCSDTSQVVLQDIPGPSISAVQTQDANCGMDNGSANVQVQSGSPPFLFNFNGGGFQPSSSQAGLSDGTYWVVVKDQNQCLDSVQFTILRSPDLSFDTILVQPALCVNNTGSIEIFMQGGQAPFQYSIDGGSNYQAGNLFSNLSSGSYPIQVLDQAGCLRDSLVVLDFLASPIIDSMNLTSSSCSGNSGSAEIFAQGNGPLLFSLNGGSQQGSGIFTNLSPGLYALEVTDTNGCSVQGNFNIQSTGAPEIDSVQTIDPSCGQNNGEVFVFGSGGQGALTYQIQGGSWQASSSFANLGPGSFWFYVQDGSGCKDSVEVSLRPVPPPVLSLSQNQAAGCGANNGSATVVVSQGSSPFEYQIDGGAFSSSNTFSNLSPGTHEVVVRDSLGCTDTLSFTTGNLDELVFQSLIIEHPKCDQNNGSIQAQAGGGQAGYTYEIIGLSSNTSGDFFNMGPGNYQLQITDSRGCQIDTNIQLIQQGGPTIDSLQIQGDTCGRNAGFIKIFAQGKELEYALNFANYQSSHVFTGLSGGNYLISVRDSNGCRIDSVVNLPTVNGPNIDSVIIAPTTCGLPNGSIVVHASGDASPFIYSFDDGISFQNDSLFSPAIAGTYDIIVEDSNGCRALTTVIVSSEPVPYIDSLAIGPVTCQGGNGSLEIFALSGEPAYSYSLDGNTWQSSASFTQLNQGNYYAYLQDSRGCKDSIPFTIDSIPPPILDSSALSNPICDQDNGSLFLSVELGSKPYQYSLDGGLTFQSDSLFQNLSAGTYSVQIQDAEGCLIDTSFSLVQQGLPNLTNLRIQREDCNLSNGEIEATVNGNPPFTFSLNGQSQSHGLFTGLSQGYYNLVITDGNGCSLDSLIHLRTIDGPIIDSIPTDSSYCGKNLGRAEIFSSDGTPPFTYSLDSGVTYQTSSVFDSLAPGFYYAVIQDSKGCLYLDSLVIDSIPAFDMLGANPFSANCGNQNGYVLVTVENGAQPVEYGLSLSNLQSSDSLGGLSPGNYTVYAKDARGCIDSLNFTIGKITKPRWKTSISQDATCEANNGFIEVSAQFGARPILYSLNGAAFSSDSLFNNLAAGVYVVEMQDVNGCRRDTSFQINQLGSPNFLSLSLSPENCDQGDGEVQAQGQGNGPFVYQLNGGPRDSTGLFTQLSAGNYTLRVIDTNQCFLDTNFVLGENQAPSLSVNNLTHASCGQFNGRVTLSGTGGSGFLSYSVDSLPFQASSQFIGLAPGMHWGYCKDISGCMDSVQFEIQDQSSPEIFELESIFNCGNHRWELTIRARGGNGGNRYSINGGSSHQTDSVFSGLNPGNYSIQVIDALGCTVDSSLFLPSFTPLSLDSIQRDPPACGRSDGRIWVFATGLQPLNFSLDGVNWQTSNRFNNLSPGSYSVSVQDSLGCIESLNFSLSNTPPPGLNIASLENPTCGQSNGSVTVQGNGSAPPFTYSIDTGSGPSPFGMDSVFDNLSPGNLTVFVADSNGCTNSFSISLNEVNNMVINSISGQSPGCGQTNGSINLSSSGGTQPHVYSVDSGATFQASSQFTNLSPGTYYLVVQDVNGCERMQPYTLNQAQGPAIDLIESKATTCGVNSGKIEFFVSGGTAPYQFSIDGGASFQAQSLFTQLPSGLYPLVVQDQKLCEVRDSILIDSIPPPNWDSIRSVDANCLAIGGEIRIYAKGSKPLLYSINGGNSYQRDSVFRNLPPGNYPLQVMDSVGCLLDSNVQIGFLNLGKIDSSHALPDTCSRGLGQIIVFGSGDTSNLSYRINMGAWQRSPVFDSLFAGIYTLDVNHPSGCSDQIQVNLLNQRGPNIDSLRLSPVRCLTTSGAVQVFVSGGNQFLEFQYDGGPWVSNSNKGQLQSGQHWVMVRDGFGCSDSLSFTIDSVPPIDLVQAETSFALCDTGSARVRLKGQGGFAPYLFSLDGMNWQSDSVFTGLSDGNYMGYIQDSSSCIDSLSFNIQRLLSPDLIEFSFQNPTCTENNGKISITALGNGLSIQWTQYPSRKDSVLDSLDAGVYALRLLDTNGCSFDTSFVLNRLNGPVIDSVLKAPKTCGSQNASLEIFATGSQGPLEYSLDGAITFQNSGLFLGLDSGTYQIVVRDTNGCMASRQVYLQADPEPVLDTALSSTAYCSGANGSVILIAKAGVSPFSFAVDQSGFGPSNNISGLSPGWHMAYLQDANACLDSLPFFIDDQVGPIKDSLYIKPTACGKSFGEILISARGKAQPFEFDFGFGFQSDSVLGGLATGWHSFWVRDTNGCLLSDSAFVPELGPPSIKGLSQFKALCQDSTGSITVHGQGNGVLSYAINGGAWQSDSVFLNLPPGQYQISVQDSNGCLAGQSFSLGSDPSLQTGISPSPPSQGCAPYEASFYFNGIQNADSCSWDLGDGTIVNSCAPFTHEYKQPGCYDVRIFIRTQNGCEGDSLLPSQVCVSPTALADFESDPEGVYEPLRPMEMFNYSQSADSARWYVNGVLVSEEWEPVLRIQANPSDSTFELCLVSFPQLGCPDTLCKTFRLDQEFRWFIANAFTPNKDGLNEGFKPIFLNDPSPEGYAFKIYDRWGELLYEANHPAAFWDGKDHIRGSEFVKQDVYVWTLTFRNPITGKRVKARGRVSLLL